MACQPILSECVPSVESGIQTPFCAWRTLCKHHEKTLKAGGERSGHLYQPMPARCWGIMAKKYARRLGAGRQRLDSFFGFGRSCAHSYEHISIPADRSRNTRRQRGAFVVSGHPSAIGNHDKIPLQVRDSETFSHREHKRGLLEESLAKILITGITGFIGSSVATSCYLWDVDHCSGEAGVHMTVAKYQM